MPEARQGDDARLRRILAQRLESLELAGVELLPRLAAIPVAPREETEIQTAPETAQIAELPASSMQTTEGSSDADDSDESRHARLAELHSQVQACTQCPALVESRTQTVFGVGPVRPRLCFFGEAPGRDEDVQGEPFVGAAGQLLNRIIQAMSLDRSDVYILNVLKCRPPGNRNPEPAEIDCCRPFYEQQLEILKPELICCLGAFAAKTLLDTDLSVGRMRGKFYRYRDAKVAVTYHPAYLLRNESAKRATWDDVKMIMGEMGLSR